MAERVGVVFVHGIGSQTRSSTVRLFADPLVDWLERWHADPDRAPGLNGERARIDSHLSYGDALPSGVPAHVRIKLPRYVDAAGTSFDASEWLLAEGWWAARLEAPGAGRMVLWAARAYRRTLLRLFTALFDDLAWRLPDRVAARLGVRAADPRPAAARPASRWLRIAERALDAVGWVIDHLALLVLAAIYAVVFVPGFVFLIVPLIVLAQIPFLPQVAIFEALKLFLTEDIGDFYTYLYDEVQALHIREGILDTLRWLEAQGCDRICVVGHSQGAVVAFDAVTQSDRVVPGQAPQAISRVTKLITLGEALNNAWSLKPRELRRVQQVLPALHWVDFWSYFDPVPGARADIRTSGITAGAQIYNSIPVTNAMDVTVEHDGYFTNTEEFVVRLAQEIDTPAPERNGSRFWFPAADWDDRIERHLWRVRTLLLWRAMAMAALGLALLGRRDVLVADGQTFAGVLPFIPGVSDLGSTIGKLPGLWHAPLYGGLAILAYGLFVEVLYLVLVRPLWHFWDADVRNNAALTKMPREWKWVPLVALISIWSAFLFTLATLVMLRVPLALVF